MTILLFCLSFIAGVFYYYFRMAKTTEPRLAEEYSIFGSIIYSIKSFFGWAEPVSSVQVFQEWGTNVNLPQIPRKEFKSWIESLELPEAIKLTKDASAFGSSLNIELDWLTSEQLQSHPQLKQAVSDIVAFYCLANFKASQITDDLKAVIAFQKWQDYPHSKPQREFGRTLLAKLMDERLVIPMSPDLLLASQNERLEHAIGSILLAAEEHPEAFHKVLKALVVSSGQPYPPPQANTAPAAA